MASTLPTMADGKEGTRRRCLAALDKLCKGEDVAEIGSKWYPDANETITGYAEEFGKDPEKVINATAGISPQLGWIENLEAIRNYLQTGKHSGLSQSQQRADSAMNGGDIGKGKKVNAFANAILGDHEAVTIDRHMLGAMGFDPNLSIHPGRYDLLVEVFLQWLATRHGDVSPRDSQAGVWLLRKKALEAMEEK